MDNPLTPQKQNIAVEDALHTYPLAEMPRDITIDVMSRIQTIPAIHLFRPAWSDLLLAFVLSLCVGAIWFSVYYLPPLIVAQIRKESILFYQYLLVNARWLIPMISFSAAGLLIALTLPYLKRELTRQSV
jgi:hypothetical protein